MSEFALHKMLYDVEFDGRAVPGLCGAFYRRTVADRVESVGIYLVGGVELFRAWGYADEEHCSHHCVSMPDGGTDGPYLGCPNVEVVEADDRVSGIVVHTATGRHRHTTNPLATGSGVWVA